jgi:hypothetical protein
MLQVTVLPFPLAVPGNTAVGQVEFTSPANESYTASITDPNSVFTVTELSAVRPTSEVVVVGGGDPGDGVKSHPHKGTIEVDVPVGATNGVNPLNVLGGDKLTVSVQMVCPQNPADTYSATLTINSSNPADTTAVPLTWATGEVDVQVLNTNATAVPGSTATWLLKVQSLAGAGANISFDPELDGFPGGVAPPASVNIPAITAFLPHRGQLILALNAAVGAVTPPFESYQFGVAETIFNGADRFTPFSLSLTVTNPPVLVTSAQPSTFDMVAGTQIQFSLHAETEGAAGDFELTINPTPPELTCVFLDAQGNPIPKWSVTLPAKSGFDFPVRVSADLATPLSPVHLSFAWSAFNGTEQGTLDFGIMVLPQAIQFSSGTLGPSTTTGSAFWTLNAQGFWNFSGSVHESGLVGHAYGFGMSLNVQDPNGWGPVVVHSGSVGQNLGPIGNPNDSWSDSGFDQRVIDLWPAIVSAQSLATLNVDTDASHILPAVLEALGIVHAVGLLVVGLVIGGQGWTCDRATVQGSGDNGGFGVDVTWTCHP